MSTAAPSDALKASAPGLLNGWKDIAAYLGKGVRTVQRWEVELGLPVHRMGTGRGETVYALAQEIDKWRQTAEASGAADEPESNGGTNSAARGPAPGGDDRRQEPADVPADPAETPPGPGTGLRPLVVGIAALALVATAAWAGWILHSRLGRGDSTPTGGAAGRWVLPSTWTIENDTLSVYDSDAHFLWEHRFDFVLTEAAYESSRQAGHDPVVIDDIDGDLKAEVLFVSEPGLSASRGLFCFNSDGTLRFRHQSNARVTFGPLECAPPWRATSLKVFGEPGRPHRLYLVSLHVTEFPTVVELLGPDGHLQGAYWSNGQVVTVEEGRLGDRSVVLIGATNNETKGGSLAVLDAGRPSGAAPAVNPHYRCAGCPPEAPLAFLVFPRLDVARAVESYSVVSAISVDDLGQIALQVRHGTEPAVPDGESRFQAQSLYSLTPDFRVSRAELGARYAAIHRTFEARGLLDHPFGAARDGRDLWPVLRWNGSGFDKVAGPEVRR